MIIDISGWKFVISMMMIIIVAIGMAVALNLRHERHFWHDATMLNDGPSNRSVRESKNERVHSKKDLFIILVFSSHLVGVFWFGTLMNLITFLIIFIQ